MGALPAPAKSCRAVKSAVTSSTLSSSANFMIPRQQLPLGETDAWKGLPMGSGDQHRRCRMASRRGSGQVPLVVVIHESCPSPAVGPARPGADHLSFRSKSPNAHLARRGRIVA